MKACVYLYICVCVQKLILCIGTQKALKNIRKHLFISVSSPLVLLAGQEASCLSLESDDDDGQFEISLLLQLSQNSRPEEHLTLTDAIQVRIQIQVLHLEEERRRRGVKQKPLLFELHLHIILFK